MRLRALYKMRRSGSAAVYATDSLGSVVKQVKYLSLIAEGDREIIRDYASALDRLTERETEIAKKQGEILNRRQAVEARGPSSETARQRGSRRSSRA
jgi:septal ring factor EnvC (AmiA/AmiB activator)